MAEESEEKQEEQAKGKSPVLLIAIVGIVALALGAGGTYFLVVGGVGGESETSEEAGEAAEVEAPVVPFTERLLPLDPFVVNVSSDPYPRYLKIRMELELDAPEHKPKLEERIAQIRDSLIVLITSKRLSDVSAFEGKALLKEEILDRINGLIPEPAVRSVLFTEFVIQ